MRDTESILQTKENIELKLGIPRDKQRLFYQGKQLEDDKTIFDYKLYRESWIQLHITGLNYVGCPI